MAFEKKDTNDRFFAVNPIQVAVKQSRVQLSSSGDKVMMHGFVAKFKSLSGTDYYVFDTGNISDPKQRKAAYNHLTNENRQGSKSYGGEPYKDDPDTPSMQIVTGKFYLGDPIKFGFERELIKVRREVKGLQSEFDSLNQQERVELYQAEERLTQLEKATGSDVTEKMEFVGEVAEDAPKATPKKKKSRNKQGTRDTNDPIVTENSDTE